MRVHSFSVLFFSSQNDFAKLISFLSNSMQTRTKELPENDEVSRRKAVAKRETFLTC